MYVLILRRSTHHKGDANDSVYSFMTGSAVLLIAVEFCSVRRHAVFNQRVICACFKIQQIQVDIKRSYFDGMGKASIQTAENNG